MTQGDTAVRKKLIALKDELAALSEISEDARAPVTLDQQSVGRLSRMDAMQMQAMAQAAERQRNHAIQKAEAAIHRLDEGEYGYCLECGEKIAATRLEIDPSAPLCIRCASGAETRG